MVLYAVLVVVVLAVLVAVLRLGVVRQLIRGNGTTRGRSGSNLDNFFGRRGTGPAWLHDGDGKRETNVSFRDPGERE